jgi:hypothetical protein
MPAQQPDTNVDRTHLLPIMLVLSMLTVNTYASQHQSYAPPEKWSLSIGSFSMQDFDSTIRVDSSTGIGGTSIILERDLRVESSTDAGRITGYYRFNDKHRLDFSHYQFNRQGSTSLNIDISYGDQTFATNTRLDTEIKNEITKISYNYSLININKFEFGIGAGLHLSKTSVTLQAPSLNEAERASGSGLLPVLSYSANYRVSDRFSIGGKNEHFFLDQDSYKGSFNDFYLTAEYMFSEHWGIGAGYNSLSFNFDTDDGSLRGGFSRSYRGLLVYLATRI